MDELVIPLLTLVLYFTVGTLIAWVSRRKGIKTTRDYYVAGYRLSGVLSAISYAATTYSAFMMVGLVGLTYMTGVGAFGFETTYLIATVFLLTGLSERAWRLARERGWVSPSEMVADLYGSKWLGLLVSIMYLLSLIPYASAQLIGVGVTVQGMSGDQGFYVMGVFLGVVAGLIWMALSGIWSLATTDLYQGLWMILAALSFIIWLFSWGFGSPEAFSSAFSVLGEAGYLGLREPWTPITYLSYTIPWIFFALTNPQVVQKIYMPKDRRALRRMVTLFTLFGMTYTVIVTMVGLMGRALSLSGKVPLVEDRDLVTPTLLRYAPPMLSAFVFTSIVAAAMTTMDAIVFTLSSSLARDVYMGLFRGKEERAILVGRASILALLAALSAVALARPGFIVELSVIASMLLLPLAPVILVGWLFPEIGGKARVGAYLSLLSGFSLGLYWSLVNGAKRALITPILGLPPSAVILIVSTAVLLPFLRR